MALADITKQIPQEMILSATKDPEPPPRPAAAPDAAGPVLTGQIQAMQKALKDDEELMVWCEKQGVHYVFGLARNKRLAKIVGAQMQQARVLHQSTGNAARVFAGFGYRTHKSWTSTRRVVAKAEYLDKGENPRFVVTSLSPEAWPDQALYEKFYCARGEMENRIKEQMCLFADRLSTGEMKGNQLRLYLSALSTMRTSGQHSRSWVTMRLTSSTEPEAASWLAGLSRAHNS